MGWCIDISRPELKKIFKEAGRRYRAIHPQSSQQTVTIEYEAGADKRELQARFKQRIAELFPDFVYIEFVKNDMAPEQVTWDE